MGHNEFSHVIHPPRLPLCADLTIRLAASHYVSPFASYGRHSKILRLLDVSVTTADLRLFETSPGRKDTLVTDFPYRLTVLPLRPSCVRDTRGAGTPPSPPPAPACHLKHNTHAVNLTSLFITETPAEPPSPRPRPLTHLSW